METIEADLLARVTVERLMEDLNQEERTILHLRFYEDASFERIGEEIGMRFREPPRELTSTGARYLYINLMEKIRTEVLGLYT